MQGIREKIFINPLYYWVFCFVPAGKSMGFAEFSLGILGVPYKIPP
ncbi:hypothetical protein SynPROSU1_02136 [Synechococcus sp. PROS-U-1]|nr:hypothetical protein SynPROSU1_02136 [Synechococcus sp. PROS-U-1]